MLANDNESNEGDSDPINQAEDYDNRFNALVHHRGVNDTLQGCLPPHSGDTGSYTSNYSKLSNSDQKDWKDKLQDAGIALGATSPGGGGGPDAGADEAVDDVNCSGGALGWILCPVINLMATATSTLASFIDGLMNYSLLANDPTAVQKAWSGLLSVANIMLVLAFLVIIFSQSTSMGLSSYGIKRMLPRLLLAAILINVSFYICAFAVDISNIVGSSITGFLTGGGSIGAAVNAQLGGSAETGTFQNIAGGLAAGAAIVAIIAFVLIPVVLSFLLVFLLLAARLVLLSLLIIISPLAFAAWLLPNTESYFKKWWDLFMKLLVIYPAVMAMFGASLLVANLIDSFDLPDLGGSVSSLIKLAVLAVPLFALPKMLMSTNSMMGTVGNLGQKFNKAIENSRLGKAAGAAPRNAIKNRALNAEARMAASNSSALGRIGGARTRQAMKNKHREALRERMHEQAYHAEMAGDDPRAESRRAKAMGIGGVAAADEADRLGRQARGYEVAKERERLNEELKSEALKLEAQVMPGDVDELKRRLDEALNTGDAVGTRALMARFGQEGKSAVAQMGDVMKDAAAGGVFTASPAMERAVAEQRQADWTTIKAADPMLAGLNLTDSDHGAAGTSSVSVEQKQLATMAGSRLEELAESGAITPSMVGEAAAKGELAGLDGGRRKALETGLGGEGMIETLRVQYEAAPLRAAGSGSTGGSGPNLLGPDGKPFK